MASIERTAYPRFKRTPTAQNLPIFLLQYLSDPGLRKQITEMTNKVESYNGFSQWIFFGGEGIIAENDPEEQEKIIKYNDLVANAVIFQNVVAECCGRQSNPA
jgi:TnpA family transposase